MKWLTTLLLLLPLAGNDTVEVDLWKITGIEYEIGGELPDWISDLDGQQVKISGFMYNSGPVRDIEEFLLITDSCGCGGQLKVHHFVQVTLPEGIDYQSKMIGLTGKMSVGEVEEDGYVVNLYRLSVEKVDED